MEQTKNVPKTLDNAVIDVANMCIDRSTPEGKMFDQLHSQAAAKAGTPAGDFMAQMLAFTEAAVVINKTMTGEEAEAAMNDLREAMQGMIDKGAES